MNPINPQVELRQQGDEFLRLLNQHEAGIQAFLFSLVPHWADVQDLAQELRLRLWQQFDDYDRTKDFGAWARTIGVYLVLAHRERLSRHRTILLDESSMQAVARDFDPDTLRRVERQTALQLCIAELAEQSRSLLVRYYAGTESMQQMAEQIGSAYGALQRRLHRIRAVLGDCVRRRLQEDAS